MKRSVVLSLLLIIAIVSLSLGACAGPAPEPTKAPVAPTKEAFDLDALIKAAQKEGELIAYFTSSRITNAGANFEKAYGIKVKGTKMADPEQTERVVRGADAKNVQVDVIGFEDGPLLETKLIPEGYVTSWLPPDMKGIIPDADTAPLVYQWQPRMFGYNTEAYGDKCPVTNVWQLTEPAWKGKVILRDPALTPANLSFFSTIVSQPKILEQAYKDLYGKDIVVKEANAGWEFLRKLFENDMLVMSADGDIGDAVGAAGQKQPPLGMYTLTKHRDVKDKNLKIATCRTMKPFMGYQLPTYAVLVNNAPHPNAAKLFIHYLLTPEGIAPWTKDDMGGFSPNPNAFVNPNNEGTWADWQKVLVRLDNKTAMSQRQALSDFWLQYGAKKK